MTELSHSTQRSTKGMGMAALPSTMKLQATASKMTMRSASNFFDSLHARTPVVAKNAFYERLKLTSCQQYFREDWGGVTALRYLPNSDKLAVGFNSGELLVCPNTTSTKIGSGEAIVKGWEGNEAISCIRFDPKKPSMMYASTTGGMVLRRDLEDQTSHNDFFICQLGNEIYSMETTASGALVTVGRDAVVRIYDVTEDKLVAELGHRYYVLGGQDFHEKRIYSVRCHPGDPNVMVTGGWDGVKVWDLRLTKVVRSISGPFVFGDSVDVCQSAILTASCVAQNCLQLWDLGSGFLMQTVSPTNRRAQLYGEYPYAAQFLHGDSSGDLVFLAVGGLQLISIKEATILCFFEDEKAVEAIDSQDRKFAAGGKSCSVLHGKMMFPDGDIKFSQSYYSCNSQVSEYSHENSKMSTITTL